MQVRSLTDIGLKRKINQDYVFESAGSVGSFPNLFVLADGLGGHKGGDFASKFLTETLVGYISRQDTDDYVGTLREGIDLANELIYTRSIEVPELNGMGSTLVAAFILDDTLTVANVGDSRLYIIRDGITQVTRDHSYVDELCEQGVIRRDSDEYIRMKNIITRAVGTEERVVPDFFEVDLVDGDYVLLCSDGLSNMVDDDTIHAVIAGRGSLQYKTKLLIDTANAAGGYDNIAVILIRVDLSGERDAGS